MTIQTDTSARIPILLTSVFCILLAPHVTLAGKGGKGGGRDSEAASMTFRDWATDAIRSDGLGAYVDGESGLDVTTNSATKLNISLHLSTPNPTSRGIVFDRSKLVVAEDSTPPEQIPGGVGRIVAVAVGPRELPAVGETRDATFMYIIGEFASTSRSGTSMIVINGGRGGHGTITAVDADTFVWELSPDEEIGIRESLLERKGNRLVQYDVVEHGYYTNCSLSVMFTRNP